MSTRLRRPGPRVLELEADLAEAQARIRLLEHHLWVAIRHIADEKHPPRTLVTTATTLLEKK